MFAASKPAAIAVAVAGVIALLLFLLVDLPDANAVGTLDDARQSFFDAEAVPQGGFCLELVGALALAITRHRARDPHPRAARRAAARERGAPRRPAEGRRAEAPEPAPSAAASDGSRADAGQLTRAGASATRQSDVALRRGVRPSARQRALQPTASYQR